MSLARVYRVEKSRKSFVCGKCGDTIEVGQPNISFAVGFRGRSQRRCDKSTCYPPPSERESSMVSGAYAAQEGFDAEACHSLDDLQQAVTDVAEQVREVAGQYEEAYETIANEEHQERADTLNTAADDLETWEPNEEEPVEEEWSNEKFATFEEAYDDWLQAARDEATSAVNEMELP